MRSVTIRFEDELNGWRIYWGSTEDLADQRVFQTIAEAGPIARFLLWPHLRLVDPRPKE